MITPSLDPGNVRWFVFIPDQGKFAVPEWVTDREGYARRVGATRLFFGNKVRWRPDQGTSGRAGHLAVVR